MKRLLFILFALMIFVLPLCAENVVKDGYYIQSSPVALYNNIQVSIDNPFHVLVDSEAGIIRVGTEKAETDFEIIRDVPDMGYTGVDPETGLFAIVFMEEGTIPTLVLTDGKQEWLVIRISPVVSQDSS